MMMLATMLVVVLLAQAGTLAEKALSGEDYLKSLKGTYVELFSSQTCLSPQLEKLWTSEAAKYVGEAQADATVKKIVGMCQGSKTGETAVEYYKQQGTMQFCCNFMQGVAKFAFAGNRISGVDKNGKKVFSHRYHFVGKDEKGCYIFESNDNNQDEFRFFWMQPDSPSTTFHIEFRYGSDKAALSDMMTGKYAYWMAAGVREGHTEEWQNAIKLFVEERLSNK